MVNKENCNSNNLTSKDNYLNNNSSKTIIDKQLNKNQSELSKEGFITPITPTTKSNNKRERS